MNNISIYRSCIFLKGNPSFFQGWTINNSSNNFIIFDQCNQSSKVIFSSYKASGTINWVNIPCIFRFIIKYFKLFTDNIMLWILFFYFSSNYLFNLFICKSNWTFINFNCQISYVAKMS